MYREVVGHRMFPRAPETKRDDPGGNRAHQAAYHLRDARYLNLVCEHSEFRMDGVGKSCSVHGKEHTNFPWITSQGFTTCLYTQIMDVFRVVLGGSVLRLDRPVFRIMRIIIYLPHAQ